MISFSFNQVCYCLDIKCACECFEEEFNFARDLLLNKKIFPDSVLKILMSCIPHIKVNMSIFTIKANPSRKPNINFLLSPHL